MTECYALNCYHDGVMLVRHLESGHEGPLCEKHLKTPSRLPTYRLKPLPEKSKHD